MHDNRKPSAKDRPNYFRLYRKALIGLCVIASLPPLYWNMKRRLYEYDYMSVYKYRFLETYWKGYAGKPRGLDEYEQYLMAKSQEPGGESSLFESVLNTHRRAHSTLTVVRTGHKYHYSIHFHWLFGGTEEFDYPQD